MEKHLRLPSRHTYQNELLNNMKKRKQQSGFTLIETLIAVLILTLSIGGLLSLAAGGFYSVRYARNQIVANNLLQESLEYVRNSRDTAFIQGLAWDAWQDTLQVDSNGSQTGVDTDGCFNTNGCTINPYNTGAHVKACGTTCANILYFPDNAFYGYNDTYPFTSISASYQTSFVRKIRMAPSSTNPDQVVVIGTITWQNGSSTKTISQNMLITNWQP